MPLWRITVNAGACARAGETAAAPNRVRTARPVLTSEAVVESQRKPQGLAGRHSLGHVQPESTPIEAQAEVREPTAECRQPVGGEPARPAADEPRLPGVPEHHEIGTLEPEQRLNRLVLRARRAVRPMQGNVPAVFGLRQDHTVACRDQRPRERGVHDVAVAGAVAEPVARERAGPAHGAALLEGEGIPPDPSTREQAKLAAPRRAQPPVPTEAAEPPA